MPTQLVARENNITHKGVLATHLVAGEHNVSDETAKVIADRAQKAVKLQRKQGELLTPQALQILMNIYIQPGITMQGLEKPTGLNLSSVSRNLQALGEWHRLGLVLTLSRQ
jgi:hypothetical protein